MSRQANFRKHIHHFNTLEHGTDMEANTLLAYGSPQFHDAILNVFETAVKEGLHNHPSAPKHEKDLMLYFGNQKINKKAKNKHIQDLALQGGGSWRHFIHRLNHSIQGGSGMFKNMRNDIKRRNNKLAANNKGRNDLMERFHLFG